MSPNERFQPSFSLNFCARRPAYLAENDATSDAMSSRHVPCYAADLVALSKVSRDGKDELQCLGHIMRQKRSSKITPMAFSSQSLASYLAENGHDIRQMTVAFSFHVAVAVNVASLLHFERFYIFEK
jgi:hypothetical protein